MFCVRSTVSLCSCSGHGGRHQIFAAIFKVRCCVGRPVCAEQPWETPAVSSLSGCTAVRLCCWSGKEYGLAGLDIATATHIALGHGTRDSNWSNQHLTWGYLV